MNKFFIITLSLFFISQHIVSQGLVKITEDKIDKLEQLIERAENKNIQAHKEKMTVRTAEVFLKFAEWDEANVLWNTEAFKKVARYKDNAAEIANNLAKFERTEVIIMLNEAIETLTSILNENIKRPLTPEVDWSKVTLEGDQLTYNNRPVFLTDYTWKPKTSKLTEFHGNQGGYYFDPNFISNARGKINPFKIKQLEASLNDNIGFVFLGNKRVPDWAEDKYGPGFKMREDTYTGYDIDNPGAREMMGYLLEGVVPLMSGTKDSELGYMLCNEPHFYTTKTGKKLDWASGPVSEYTFGKFRVWLREKHKSIAELNQLWDTNFTSFNNVVIDIPIDNSLQGTPMWYDWQFFNNYRVTEWYQWLKGAFRENDLSAKIHLKVMPNLWTNNKRGHGLNMEDLNILSDILGNDFGAENSYMWGGPKQWEEKYSFDWRELCMGSDFFKSVGPDKIMYNTELHFLSKGGFREIWYWSRNADGSPNSKALNGNGYAGSLVQQPRIVNEVHSTMMDLNSYAEYITAMQRQRKPLRLFYSETSALNKPKHMDDVYELYESLFFEGLPLGFATEKIIKNQDNALWDMILIYKTEFVTADEFAALQRYLDNGGTILIDSGSLERDEYGRPHNKELFSSKGKLIQLESLDAFNMQALKVLKDKDLLPELKVTETNKNGIKGCTWRTVKNRDGNKILSVTNLGKTDASLNIELIDTKYGTTCRDLLTSKIISNTPILKPYEVLFVEVIDKKKDNAKVGLQPLTTSNPADEWIIKWSASDEFDNDSINWSKWIKGGNLPYTTAWKWDNEANVKIDKGVAELIMRHNANNISDEGTYFKSGILKSYRTFTYGYFEAKIKGSELGEGVCPAFWLYSDFDHSVEEGEPVYSEIDVVELQQFDWYKGHQDDIHDMDLNLHAVVKQDGESVWRRPKMYPDEQLNKWRAPFDPTKDFHIYGCEVNEEEIIWYVDGVEVARKPNTYWTRPMNVALSLGLRKPFVEFFNNRNNAINPETSPKASSKLSGMPASMYVDYVRVWEKR